MNDRHRRVARLRKQEMWSQNTFGKSWRQASVSLEKITKAFAKLGSYISDCRRKNDDTKI